MQDSSLRREPNFTPECDDSDSPASGRKMRALSRTGSTEDLEQDVENQTAQ